VDIGHLQAFRSGLQVSEKVQTRPPNPSSFSGPH
jgi:hypothetical protein